MSIKLASKEQCTGCSACFNVCPKSAITMEEDDCGFARPLIDFSRCVECHSCEKACPQLAKECISLFPKKAYAAISKDSKITSRSTSGGAAGGFYQYWIEQAGVAYGVAKDPGSLRYSFRRITSSDEIASLQGSKYFQAFVGKTYQMVKKDLSNGLKVLFIGTPCQVAGLKCFLHSEPANLLCVDIICHGVPSQQMFLAETISHGLQPNEISKVTFRNKTSYHLTIEGTNNSVLLSKEPIDCRFFEAFLRGVSLRPSCQNCSYSRPERISDVTLGDFWGLNPQAKMASRRDEGISLILINTQKGLNFVNNVAKDFWLEERPVEEAILGNSNLQKPLGNTNANEKFLSSYAKNPTNLEFSVKKTRSLRTRIKYLKPILWLYKKRNNHDS